jgi:hypothetical protein
MKLEKILSLWQVVRPFLKHLVGYEVLEKHWLHTFFLYEVNSTIYELHPTWEEVYIRFLLAFSCWIKISYIFIWHDNWHLVCPLKSKILLLWPLVNKSAIWSSRNITNLIVLIDNLFMNEMKANFHLLSTSIHETRG